MLKLKCYQCHNSFADEDEFCPHCGAVRKENPAQAGMRLIQRFGRGALLGAVIGGGSGLVVSALVIIYDYLFRNLVRGFELDTIKFYGGIGLVVGTLLGGVAKIVRQLVRED